MNTRLKVLLFACIALVTPTGHAAFHIMQVEQVIGSLNGDTSAQAIQLRMRTSGQTLVSNASLWASDAGGTNRVLLLNIATNVSSGATGDHILLTTAAFTNTMIAGGAATFLPDFTLAQAIPSSYLSAGRLTFEDDSGSVSTPGTIYWALAWGGTSYTGSTLGNTTNDADGNFGKFGSAVPSGNLANGLLFGGAANAVSTTNSADYAVATNPATVTKNNGTAFTVVPEPAVLSGLIVGALALGALRMTRRHAPRS